ncbi:MAG: LPS export ABC transporter permease LptG [Shimia sp.]
MTLHAYLARRFAMTLAAVFAIFAGLLALFDLMDQVRRHGGEASFGDLLILTALSAPEALYTILPLILIIATLALFLRLARTSELVVARAAGRSALHSLAAPALVTLAVGVFAVAVLNPIIADTQREYEARAAAISGDEVSTLSLSDEGLWLRQGSRRGQTVIRAEAADLDGTRLSGVTFLTFSPEGRPVRRIDAASATLRDGEWVIEDAKRWPLGARLNAEQGAARFARLTLASNLTADRIRDSFGTPSAIGIWELPRFISQLERSGFSARRHAMWFHMELATPAFLLAMLLVGAGFTMQHTRVSRTGVLVMWAVMLGFGLYFLRNFAQILGESGQMPILLAAWAPPLGAILLALGILLHLEDG